MQTTSLMTYQNFTTTSESQLQRRTSITSHPPIVVHKTKDVPVFHPVVIIGAGSGGIGMACELKNKLGFEDVHIFERRSGVGGTWWSNRYPGVACDM